MASLTLPVHPCCVVLYLVYSVVVVLMIKTIVFNSLWLLQLIIISLFYSIDNFHKFTSTFFLNILFYFFLIWIYCNSNSVSCCVMFPFKYNNVRPISIQAHWTILFIIPWWIFLYFFSDTEFHFLIKKNQVNKK